MCSPNFIWKKKKQKTKNKNKKKKNKKKQKQKQKQKLIYMLFYYDKLSNLIILC